mgnify:CR=1 FL=1
MTVRREGAKRWRVDLTVKRGGEVERIRRRATTRDGALRIEADLRARHARGEAPTTSAPLFSEWAKDFLDVYATTNNKPSEQRSKLQIVRDHLLPFFGDTRLDRISIENVERFKAEQLKRKAAAKSVNNRLTVLRKLLAVAVDWQRIGSMPKIRWLKTAPSKWRFLTFGEADRLVASAKGEQGAMILFALRTGLRLGELLALQWPDIDLTRGVVQVTRNVWRGVEGSPKGGRARMVELSADARGAVHALPSRFVGKYVFGPGSVRLTAGETKRWTWNASKAAGISRCGWHVLRHTFASHLAMSGVPMKTIQELMGHTDMAQTMRYAHLSTEVRSDAVNRLDRGPRMAHGTTGS